MPKKKTNKKDTTLIYKNIQTYSGKSKFTKFMYHLVFRPVAGSFPIKETKKEVKTNLKQKTYGAFEGKIIRYINIETLDPFGYSVKDTNVRSQNFLSNTGNKLHVKSQHITIRNLLLIKQNQVFDSLLVKESERLVRSRGYVHDVSFTVQSTSINSDSVDIFIRELDNWSINANASASNSLVKVNLNDKNFLGLGHEFKNAYNWYHNTGEYAYNTNYAIPNFRNTYINTTLHYGTDEFKNLTKSLAIERPFFSPFAKWAAGFNFTQQLRYDSIKINDSLKQLQGIKFNTQDYWVGNSMQIFKGNTENDRTTNFISTIRYIRIRYLEKPIEIYDTNHVYANEDFYLASIGISTRKYVQDYYVFKYGTTEDIPIGKVYSLTGGYQVKNNKGRFYLGSRIAFGNYYKWGYLSSAFEYGTYFHNSRAEQGVFITGVDYYTRLLEIGKWKFRQFAKSQFTIGINRIASDSITLNDGYGIDGFNSPTLSGTSRLLFTMQTQSYAPWNIIGFHFGPFLICSFGMLGDAETGLKNSRLYSQIGLGVLIKNENLVISNFQISISYFPLIPDNGRDIIKLNSFRTSDFGFRNFEMGTPGTEAYQ